LNLRTEYDAASLIFQYATCKLADLDLAPWIAAGNPVARVIQAHRLAQRTGKKLKARRSGKLGMVRQLLESGMSDAATGEARRSSPPQIPIPMGCVPPVYSP
jgi:hypothetical protein